MNGNIVFTARASGAPPRGAELSKVGGATVVPPTPPPLAAAAAAAEDDDDTEDNDELETKLVGGDIVTTLYDKQYHQW